MNTIGKDYIARKHGKQNVSYIHQTMKEFTDDTYGCILYQEQVMQACVYLGGMTMAEADKVRKIIGKKKMQKSSIYFKIGLWLGRVSTYLLIKPWTFGTTLKNMRGTRLTKATQLLTLLSRIGRRG
jgi:hypothetical protein